MDRDDAQLMTLVQQGRMDCFDELVRRYRSALIRFAAGKLGDRQRGEDLVQETFLAVYASRQTYNPEFSFRTWLWTILLNLCRRELRKRSRRPKEVHAAIGGDPQVTPGVPEPATKETALTSVLQSEQTELLNAMLDSLPEVQADAVRLRFFGFLKYREIAQAMGSSEVTAKVRVRTGLQKLAGRLRDELGETP